jgi:hypothetical protein
MTVTVAMFLAQEVTKKTLWNPTLLGILVVLSAIGLFCGSVYLLLGTNLGARLGFLVAAACLTGFLVLLSILWMTTFTPLESPKGRGPTWKVKEVVPEVTASKVQAVHDIANTGAPLNDQNLATIRPSIDAALVVPNPALGGNTKAGPLAHFSSSLLYLTGSEYKLSSYVQGGGTRLVFWHHPKYAVIEYCIAEQVSVPFGEKPPPPRCDPLQPHKFVVLELDLGTLRQPPFFFFIAFLVLFLLSLRGLHWYELDQRRQASRELTPVTTS